MHDVSQYRAHRQPLLGEHPISHEPVRRVRHPLLDQVAGVTPLLPEVFLLLRFRLPHRLDQRRITIQRQPPPLRHHRPRAVAEQPPIQHLAVVDVRVTCQLANLTRPIPCPVQNLAAFLVIDQPRHQRTLRFRLVSSRELAEERRNLPAVGHIERHHRHRGTTQQPQFKLPPIEVPVGC